jgi:hypothetical protein
MRVLTLSIRQKFFDQILAGEKKVETREIMPTNFNKYVSYLYGDGKLYKNGDPLPDGEFEDLVPEKYDVIKFLTGEYKGKRPYIVVKVKSAKTFLIQDEKGEFILYEWTDGEQYNVAVIDYELGEIIETQLYNV